MSEANDQVPTTGRGSNDLFGADAVASAENKLVEPAGATPRSERRSDRANQAGWLAVLGVGPLGWKPEPQLLESMPRTKKSITAIGFALLCSIMMA